jgi:hypothetical protein
MKVKGDFLRCSKIFWLCPQGTPGEHVTEEETSASVEGKIGFLI